MVADAGYENAFNVVNEVKNPVEKIRNSGFSAVLLVATLYMLASIAYFAAGKCLDVQEIQT